MSYLLQWAAFAAGIELFGRRILRGLLWSDESWLEFRERSERMGFRNHSICLALYGAYATLVLYLAGRYAALEEFWQVLSIFVGIFAFMFVFVAVFHHRILGAWEEEPVPKTIKDWQQTDDYKRSPRPIVWPEAALLVAWIYAWQHLWQG